MAKNKNGKGKKQQQGNAGAAIQRLSKRVEDLAKQARPAGGKKKNRSRNRRKSGSRVSHGATLANFSPFARGFLDPFGAYGVRVPDSVLLKSGTTAHKWFASASSSYAAPSYNLTTQTAYGTLIAHPIAVTPGGVTRALNYAFTPTLTKSFFDFSGNAAPLTADYTKNFGNSTVAGLFVPFDAKLGRAYRVAGGGLKLCMFNIPPQTPVDVYALAMFNGDGIVADYQSVSAKRIRHFRLDGNDEIVLPIPIRHMGEAFEWINASQDGTATAAYPSDDKVGAGQTIGSYVTTASTDVTNTNCGIQAWSPQSGLGGWQIAFNLPPMAGWRAEFVIHFEVLSSATVPSGMLSEGDTKVSFANSGLMETVANITGHTAMKEEVMHGGVANPWDDFVKSVGNSTASSLAKDLATDAFIDMAGNMIRGSLK